MRPVGRTIGLMSSAEFTTGTRSQPLGDRKSGVSTDLDAIAAHNNVSLTVTQLAQVAAFVAQIGSEEPAVPSTASGGLLGSYFTNIAMSGTAALVRTEAVDFDWGSGSQGAAVAADNFSARWSGSVQATTTGNYRFRTVSDDGVRLWINNVLVVDNWTDQAPTTNTSGTVPGSSPASATPCAWGTTNAVAAR